MKVIFQNQYMSPKVSIVLLDWNCRESFHILEYLSNQSVSRDKYEVIWIEYYSRQAHEIQSQLDRTKQEGKPPVVDKWIVMETPDNIYYHKHLMYNIGILASSSEIVAICDSDAIVTPNFVETLINSFKKNRDIVLHLDEVRNVDKKHYPFDNPTLKEIIGHGCINYKGGKTIGMYSEEDIIHTRNYGSCMAAFRQDLIDIGGADEHIDYLGHVCGPYEMTFRLVNAGKKEIWHESEFLYHVWHPGTDGNNNYIGPHDGKNVSTTALAAKDSGRILPLVENPMVHVLRTGPKGEITNNDLSVLNKAFTHDRMQKWRITKEKLQLSQGMVEYNKGNYDEAIKHWEQVLDGMEGEALVLNKMGWISFHGHEYQKAITYFDKSVSAGLICPTNHLGKGWSYYNLGNYSDAIIEFEKSAQLAEGVEPIHYIDSCRGLAWAHFQIHNYHKALNNFKKALELINGASKNLLPDLHNVAALSYCNMGDFNEAKYHFNKVLEYAPSSDTVLIRNTTQGIKDAEAASLKSASQEKDYNLVSVCGLGQSEPGQLKECEEIEDEDVGLSEDFVGDSQSEVLAKIAFAYYNKRQYKIAYDFFNKSLDQNPFNIKALTGRGWVFLQEKLYDSALKDFNWAEAHIELVSGCTAQEIYRGKGWVFYGQKRYSEAVENFSEAMKHTIQSETHVFRELYKGRSLAYFKLGKTDKAAEDFLKTYKSCLKKKLIATVGIMGILFVRRGKSFLKKVFKKTRHAGSSIKTNMQHKWLGYPCDIPSFEVERDLDILLLELPPRYVPMMPNGLAYVNNALLKLDVKSQVIDANIYSYHKYHKYRLEDSGSGVMLESGFRLSKDPWSNDCMEEWENKDVISYFMSYLQDLIKDITDKKPKSIGLSASESNREFIKSFIKKIREVSPETLIILGGYDCIHPVVSRYLFEDYDYIVIGEADNKLEELITGIAMGEKPINLPGVISKFDHPDRDWTDIPRIEDLDSLDFPKYEWLSLEHYTTYDRKHLIPITSSRGCNWGRCRFCSECFPFRNRNPLKVVDEIEYFTKFGLHSFHFNESDVNGDPEALHGICSEIIRRKLKVRLTGQLRISKSNTAEYMQHIARAGFTHLRFGVDGWSDNLIKLQRKGYNMELVSENLRNCHSAGIFTTVNIVIGVPGETEEDVDDAIKNIISCRDYIDCVESFNTLILEYGSEYYNNPEKYNICFREDKEQLYRKYLLCVPTELWYSEDPYIDQEIRMQRLNRIAEKLHLNGLDIGAFATKVVEKLNQKKKRSLVKQSL